MDGSTVSAPHLITLEEEIGTLAAAVIQRDRDNAAAHAIRRDADRERGGQMEGYQTKFRLWAGNLLEPAVRHADTLLRPAKYSLVHTPDRWRRISGELPPEEMLTQSTLTLAREDGPPKHELTIAVFACGIVRARAAMRSGDTRRVSADVFPDATAYDLDAAYATRLIALFVSGVLKPGLERCAAVEARKGVA